MATTAPKLNGKRPKPASARKVHRGGSRAVAKASLPSGKRVAGPPSAERVTSRQAGKRAAAKAKAKRSGRAKHEAERRRIGATFDVAAFEATMEQTAAETAKHWATPY